MPRAAQGIGSVEGSRGTLIHDYETDEKGIVKYLDLPVATVQNNAAMNIAVKKMARDFIKGATMKGSSTRSKWSPSLTTHARLCAHWAEAWLLQAVQLRPASLLTSTRLRQDSVWCNRTCEG
jgi:hypothetical protein